MKRSVKRRHLRGILIAAVIAALLLILSLLAMGNDTLNDFWRQHFRDMKAGEAYYVDGDVVVKEGGGRIYDSIDAFYKAENINLLFPTKLPGQINMDHIGVTEISEKNVVFYFTTDKQYLIRIDLYTDLPYDAANDSIKTEQIHGLDCYVIKEVSFCQIEFEHKDNFYTISAPTYEDAKYIVEHLEGEF